MEMLCQAASSLSSSLRTNTEPLPACTLNTLSMSVRRSIEYLQSARTHTHTQTNVHTHMHTHARTHTHRHKHIHTRISTHTQMCTHIHAHTHTYTHTHRYTEGERERCFNHAGESDREARRCRGKVQHSASKTRAGRV